MLLTQEHEFALPREKELNRLTVGSDAETWKL